MLDFETALDLLKKYGYTSTSVHPYIYKTDTSIGVCYSLIDDKFGSLERVALFRTPQEMDDFLKKYQWFKIHGKEHNVVMNLDNYSSPSANIIYCRNGHVMASDEMFNLDKYDAIHQQKKDLVEVDSYVLVASKLMDIYNTIKDDQITFARYVDGLIEQKRSKYYELQLLVDKYNCVEREIKKLTVDKRDELAGVNIDLERTLKERLSQYKSNLPEKAEAVALIGEIWNLCFDLNKNKYYFDNKVEENSLLNEIKVADAKTEFMKKLLEKNSKYFRKNLNKEFSKIDSAISSELTVYDNNNINKDINKVSDIYSSFGEIEILSSSEFLEEVRNSMDITVKSKYLKGANVVEENIVLDYDTIVANLKEQFTKLSVVEQNSLILYYSTFQKLFNIIMSIADYNKKSITELISLLNMNKEYKNFMNLYYDGLKGVIDAPINQGFRKSIFAMYDFTSPESFITSCLKTLEIISGIENQKLNSDVEVYCIVDDYDNMLNPTVVDTTTSVAVINGIVKNSTSKSLLATLYKGTSVLYSDRYVDFGEGEGVSVLSIKVRTDNSFSFVLPNTYAIKDPNVISVSKYNSKAKPYNGVAIVDKLDFVLKNDFHVVGFKNRLK